MPESFSWDQCVLHCCSAVHCKYNSKYKYKYIQIYKYTNIQTYKYTNIQVYRYKNKQIYKYTRKLVFNQFWEWAETSCVNFCFAESPLTNFAADNFNNNSKTPQNYQRKQQPVKLSYGTWWAFDLFNWVSFYGRWMVLLTMKRGWGHYWEGFRFERQIKANPTEWQIDFRKCWVFKFNSNKVHLV